jgi:hypothetical protein
MKQILFRPVYDHDGLAHVANVLKFLNGHFYNESAETDWMQEAYQAAREYELKSCSGQVETPILDNLREMVRQIERVDDAANFKGDAIKLYEMLESACSDVVFGELGRLSGEPTYMLENKITDFRRIPNSKVAIVTYSEKD